VTTVHNTQQGT